MTKQYGVVTGIVERVNDPEGEGRILLRFPTLPGNNQSHWAPVATLMSGGGRGAWFMPEDGDEVLCAFLNGDVNHPYVIGFLWNGSDRPPTTDRKLRTIRSVNGHEVSIYDPGVSQGDTGYVRLADAHGNKVELSNGRISIRSVGAITIDAPSVLINNRPVVPTPSPI